MMISYDIYSFHYYSLLGLLNRLDDLKVEVKKYYIYEDKRYYLKINRKYRKVIKNNFNDYKIVDKIGFINAIEKLVLNPSLLVSLVVAICLFLNLSTRVYKIEINGDFPVIESSINQYLKDNNISKFSKNIDGNKIDEIELGLKEKFNDELEFIEVIKEGAIININYKKRRKELVIEGKKGSLYASKDGVIRAFYLLSGVKKVKVYDFVKKGDLLVSDILISSDSKDIYVGTIGKVFASTFYYIEVSCELDLDSASKQAYLLDKARKEVSKNLNSEDEYIESENVLVNDINKGYMKIYYVLYEDITI